MVLEGANAIDLVRTMMGATNPAQASPGTIRGDFAQRVDRNVVHGSDSIDNAAREIAIFFEESELPTYQAHHTLWL
jgi:nucleoside-diphosphate kinase